ncbi:MFS transporter, partial [Micromonospora azadirachtae]
LAMLPDCVSWDEARTGRRQAGVFTGVWTAGETLGLALGPGIYGLVLQLSGYVSSDTGTAAAQSGTARLGILLGFTVIPALLVAAPLILLRYYDLPTAEADADQPVVAGTTTHEPPGRGVTTS